MHHGEDSFIGRVLEPTRSRAGTPVIDLDDVIATVPGSQEHLNDLVDEELTEMFGHRPIRDAEGDIAIRVGSTMLFLRTATTAEIVVFATVVHDVAGRSRATEVLNDLNVDARWVKFQLIRDRVFVTLSVLARPFVPAHLQQAVRIMSEVADGIDDELAAKLNGRTTSSPAHVAVVGPRRIISSSRVTTEKRVVTRSSSRRRGADSLSTFAERSAPCHSGPACGAVSVGRFSSRTDLRPPTRLGPVSDVAVEESPPLHLTYDEALPITAWHDEIAGLVRDHPVLVIAGETGSGKTTQLPKICLEIGRRSIAHTQPRRLAARTVAQRVADEMETTLGDVVGYQVRFTRQTSRQTRLKIMTDGVLAEWVDRDLRRYDTIIVDEAHERSLNIDFLLGYLKQPPAVPTSG